MNPKYSYYNLHAKVEAMEKFIDLDKFIQGDKNSVEKIRSYYRINHWAYRHFHSQDGFMHFRISKSGCFSDEDVYLQPDTVAKYIKDGDSVVELGCGQGANIVYLANCYPGARFVGFDLQPRKKIDIPKNVTIYEQDYSSMAQIADSSVDVVYAIETLVHCSDKETPLREIRRILKPGGVIVVFDYSLSARYETFDKEIQKAIALISKGGASAMIESTEEWNEHFASCGLKVESVADHGRDTLLDLKRLERLAARTMKRPWRARLLFRLLPDQYVANIIIGYLGYDAANANIGTYHEWILRK